MAADGAWKEGRAAPSARSCRLSFCAHPFGCHEARRSDGSAGPPALKPNQSTRLFGQLSWVSISFADRDLVFQDFTLVLVPGMRLYCLPRARRERAALRAHLICEQRRVTPLKRYAGLRAMRLARGASAVCLPRQRWRSNATRSQTLVQAKRAHAPSTSAACTEPEPHRSLARQITIHGRGRAE